MLRKFTTLLLFILGLGILFNSCTGSDPVVTTESNLENIDENDTEKNKDGTDSTSDEINAEGDDTDSTLTEEANNEKEIIIDEDGDTIIVEEKIPDDDDSINATVITEWNLASKKVYTESFVGNKTFRIYPEEGKSVSLVFTPEKEKELNGTYEINGLLFTLKGSDVITKEYSVSGEYIEIIFSFEEQCTLTAHTKDQEVVDPTNPIEAIQEGIELKPEMYDSLIDLRTLNTGVNYLVEGALKVGIMPKELETDSIYGVYVGFQVGRDKWTDGKFEFTVKYSMTADGENFVTENIQVIGEDYTDFRIYPKNLNGLILEFDVPNLVSVKIARDQ